jgi:Tfp pilus assembly protein PilO
MLENLDSGTIITIVLGIVTTFAGGFWLKAKGKISKLGKLFFESYEVVAKFEAALEDDKITKAEIESLKKEAADVKAAFKDLVSKASE